MPLKKVKDLTKEELAEFKKNNCYKKRNTCYTCPLSSVDQCCYYLKKYYPFTDFKEAEEREIEVK